MRQEQKKKCTENVPALNLAIRQKNNSYRRRADKAVIGKTSVSLPFLKELDHNGKHNSKCNTSRKDLMKKSLVFYLKKKKEAESVK